MGHEFAESAEKKSESRAGRADIGSFETVRSLLGAASADVIELKLGGLPAAERIAAGLGEKIDEETEAALADVASQADKAVEELEAEIEIIEGSESGTERKEAVERVKDALAELKSLQERFPGHAGRPKVFLPADGDKIEGQAIGIMDMADRLVVSFHLSQRHHEAVLDKFKRLNAESDDLTAALAGGKELKMAGALSLEQEGTKTKVFQRRLGFLKRLSAIFSSGNPFISEAAARMVQIEIPKTGGGISPEELAEKLEMAMGATLEIDKPLQEPDAEAEKRRKLECYAWHHCQKPESFTPDEEARIEQSLTSEEVFPGYSTLVETGKHLQYEAASPCALVHEVAGTINQQRCRQIVVETLKGPGLMSRMERHQRGVSERIIIDPDMLTGGANSVFVRLVSENGVGNDKEPSRMYKYVLNPDILDRTDWYAYRTDVFGSTSQFWMNGRPTPEEFIEKESRKNRWNNEVMFRTGIPKEKILAVTCKTEEDRLALIEELRKNGFEEVNGVPVEEFVAVIKLRREAVGIANSRRGKTKPA